MLSDEGVIVIDVDLNFILILTNAQTTKKLLKKKENNSTEIIHSREIDEPGCGACPAYFQKICAVDFKTNSTFIFDNECIMNLHNCKRDTDFVRVNYERCLFFGNFAYVRGLNHDDYDYGDHVTAKYVKKNPDFIK